MTIEFTKQWALKPKTNFKAPTIRRGRFRYDHRARIHAQSEVYQVRTQRHHRNT